MSAVQDSGPPGPGPADHDDPASRRDSAALLRDGDADRRDDQGDARDEQAAARDVTSVSRDAGARSRDDAADLRDRREEDRERADGAAGPTPEPPDQAHGARAREAARADRTSAWEDRQASAEERAQADHDRTTARSDRESGRRERRQAGHDRGASAQDRHEAYLDGLTGAYVRGPGLLQLAREVARAQRTGVVLSVGFVDVDGLKQVNDAGGHAAGDGLLVRVAAALRARLRPYDLVVRYGGDEFVCVLTGLQEQEARERLALVDADLAPDASISIGVVSARADEDGEALVARADAALYASRTARDPLA